jgi:hypothetical protein
MRVRIPKSRLHNSRITLETVYFVYLLMNYLCFTGAAFMAQNRSTEQRRACSRQSEV